MQDHLSTQETAFIETTQTAISSERQEESHGCRYCGYTQGRTGIQALPERRRYEVLSAGDAHAHNGVC